MKHRAGARGSDCLVSRDLCQQWIQTQLRVRPDFHTVLEAGGHAIGLVINREKSREARTNQLLGRVRASGPVLVAALDGIIDRQPTPEMREKMREALGGNCFLKHLRTLVECLTRKDPRVVPSKLDDASLFALGVALRLLNTPNARPAQRLELAALSVYFRVEKPAHWRYREQAWRGRVFRTRQRAVSLQRQGLTVEKGLFTRLNP